MKYYIFCVIFQGGGSGPPHPPLDLPMWLIYAYSIKNINEVLMKGERSGSVVECLTRDRRAAGSSLIGATALSP